MNWVERMQEREQSSTDSRAPQIQIQGPVQLFDSGDVISILCNSIPSSVKMEFERQCGCEDQIT